MEEIKIQQAEEKDWPYIKEKLPKYALDATDADWPQFFVAKTNGKTVAFTRIIDYGEYLEFGSMGVDYYYRGKGIGLELLKFLVKEAKRQAPDKEIYGVTHVLDFVKKAGFKEATDAPEALIHKRYHRCLHPEKIKIVKLDKGN